MRPRVHEVEACGVSLYLPPERCAAGAHRVFRWARDIHSFMLRVNHIAAAGCGDTFERLSEARMVDILGMFRRRPAKRGRAGFARSRDDITALGDAFGDMLTNPVRDAPPIARDVPLPHLDLPRPPPPAVDHPRGDHQPADRP